MIAYILRRLMLMVPTILGIMIINFAIVQFAPGGPVERIVAQLQGLDTQASVGGASGGGESSGSSTGQTVTAGQESGYRGAQGLDPAFLKELEAQFGLDKPAYERLGLMIWNYARFDFGESFYRNADVLDLILEKMPVSISLGLWTTLIVYLISIPMGIAKAVRHGTRFDAVTSSVILIGYAIPGYIFAVMLLVLFAGGSYWDVFPLGGLVSPDWESYSWPVKIVDCLWHMVLPVFAMVLSGFATLTLLTKNSFLEEISKQYVVTARAKGVTEKKVLYGHIFRNAMLIVVAGFPAAFISIFITGSLLIEVIFSLDGLGLLGYESVMNRDYPVVFGTLFIYSLLGLVANLLRDLTYIWVDPRISFETQDQGG